MAAKRGRISTRRTTSRPRRSPGKSGPSTAMQLTTTKANLRAAKDRGRISTKVYAGVGAGAGVGGFVLGEIMERKAWTIGETDARLIVGPVGVGVGGLLLISKRTRQGPMLLAAVLLVAGGLGIFVNWLWTTYATDSGMYSDDEVDEEKNPAAEEDAETYDFDTDYDEFAETDEDEDEYEELEAA